MILKVSCNQNDSLILWRTAETHLTTWWNKMCFLRVEVVRKKRTGGEKLREAVMSMNSPGALEQTSVCTALNFYRGRGWRSPAVALQWGCTGSRCHAGQCSSAAPGWDPLPQQTARGCRGQKLRVQQIPPCRILGSSVLELSFSLYLRRLLMVPRVRWAHPDTAVLSSAAGRSLWY